MSAKRKINEILLSAPSLLWLTVFFVIPIFLIFMIAFKPADPYGSICPGWTLDTIKGLWNPTYHDIICRTARLSFISTGICIMIAVPVCYYIARVSLKWRGFILLLLVVPFWVNFLIRVYAWKVLLYSEGMLCKILSATGLFGDNVNLLYNEWAVLVVMVYSYLPFAILPIYAAAEKFDFSLIEAAQDLGATRRKAFFEVFIPGISRGILTALMVVLIPALGAYLIPAIVGGANSELIGDKIAQRAFVDRNLPEASALSAVLMMAVMLPLAFIMLFRSQIEEFFGKTGRNTDSK